MPKRPRILIGLHRLRRRSWWKDSVTILLPRFNVGDGYQQSGDCFESPMTFGKFPPKQKGQLRELHTKS